MSRTIFFIFTGKKLDDWQRQVHSQTYRVLDKDPAIGRFSHPYILKQL
ncbi:hypothetical protein ACFQZT_24895 [Paenibacillus sp. GCM10027628]